ncbi:hypothetical protein GR294_23330 [Raoultella sp. Lac2]|uniref:phage neck terminator protein n=1 Tax=unclassified Raoultella TaxID=2627600 RepID=UPI00135437BC|nr:hypothetical protein [Raoultella sp. Lac2]MXF98715.1 hypothetical protein [Raoultella sp. Lac1]
MSNDSTEPGYLTPVGDAPDYDKDLEKQLSRWVRGVTGMPVNMVLPRFTDPQPKIPVNGETWCGFNFATLSRPGMPANTQVSDEQSEQWSWENIQALFCFYGPGGSAMATRFRDGMFIEQNSDTFRRISGLSLVDAGEIRNLPELINNQWVRRYDLTVTLSRKNTRTYNVKSVVAESVIDANVKIITGD